MKEESELMQKRKASDSDDLPEQKKQIVEKGKFVEAVVDVIKPDAYKVAMDSDIHTNSLIALQGFTSSNISSSKNYEELVHIVKDEAMEENFKAKEDNGATKCKDGTLSTTNSQMVVEASDDSAVGKLKAVEENFKAIEDNDATNCKDGTSSTRDGQMVLEASDNSAEGNLKAVEENFKAKEDNCATKYKDGTLSTRDSQMVLEASDDSAEGNLKAVEENFKAKEDNGAIKCKDGTLSTSDSQMVLEASDDSVEGNLKAMEENFKAKEDNGATKCKDGTLSISGSQMVLEASDDFAEGNLKALSSECREHTSPIRGVIHDSPSLNETCENSLIKSSEKEGCFSFQATDETKAAEVSNNQSETLESKNDPNRGVIHDSPSLNETCEKSLIKSSEKEGCFSFQATDETKAAEVSNNQSETLESKNDPNTVISNNENGNSNNQSETLESKNDPNNQSETLESKNDPNNLISNNENGNSIGLEGRVESQSMNTSEKYSSDLVSQNKLSDANIIKPVRKSIVSKRRKLLVLDINGLLVDIFSDIDNTHRGRKRIGGKVVFKRPFCNDFVKFCFGKFDIGIWSSRKRYHVENVIEYLMSEYSHELLFCWDQDHCTFTGFGTVENANKPLVLKELKKLWNKEEKGLPWKKGYFSPSNTLLIDDSPYKALCNPPHTAIFPHPYRFDNENDNSLGPGGDLRVYLEGLYEADDVQLYVQQHPFGQQAITSEDSSWSFYAQVVEKIQGSNETQLASK